MVIGFADGVKCTQRRVDRLLAVKQMQAEADARGWLSSKVLHMLRLPALAKYVGEDTHFFRIQRVLDFCCHCK